MTVDTAPEDRDALFARLRDEQHPPVTTARPTPSFRSPTPMTTKSLTIDLKRPLTVSGQEVTKLSFREANVGDLVKAERAGVTGAHEAGVHLMAMMAEIPFEDAMRLSIDDYTHLDTVLRPLMGNGAADAAGAS